MGIDLSGVKAATLLGRMMRAPLAMLPPDTILRILQGPTRGMKWIVGASTHGCWLGSYEYRKRRQFQLVVRPGDVVYDAGANVGFYSLLSAVLVGPNGHVVAFEPLPRNLAYLRRHLELNAISNVTVIASALGRCPGRARFLEDSSPSMGRLSTNGSLDVAVSSLDDLVSRATIPGPNVLKIDIEGGESDALIGAQAVLARCRPLVFLATHGATLHAGCCDLLWRHGYALRSLDNRPIGATDEILATPSSPGT